MMTWERSFLIEHDPGNGFKKSGFLQTGLHIYIVFFNLVQYGAHQFFLVVF